MCHTKARAILPTTCRTTPSIPTSFGYGSPMPYRTSPVCRHQAFAFQSGYGLLFHLEFTPTMVRGLAEANREWAREDFNLDEDQLNREARELAPLLRAQCYRLLDNFFS